MFIIPRYTQADAVKFDNKSRFTADLFEQIIKKLEASEIHDIKKIDNKLVFKGQIFRFVWNGWNLMNGISSGKIGVEKTKGRDVIKYTLFFTEYFVISIIFSLALLPAFWEKWAFLAIFYLCVWAIFFMGNYMISVFRFNRFIDETLELLRKTHKGSNASEDLTKIL